MEINNLHFAYKTKGKEKTKIIDGISYKVPEGKITTLIGANGCGKSTLFKLMTKNLNPENGEIKFHGKNVNSIPCKAFARKVAIVHQNNQFTGDLTVKDLVSYGRNPYLNLFGTMDSKDIKIVERAMEITDIIEIKDRLVTSLSGGQRQRALIAMALAQKTRFLILDEPTTYLDIRYQIELLELIKGLNRRFGITIIMVLHDINHAVYYSDEIVGMKDGKLVIQGNPREVITSDSIEDIFGIRLKVEEYHQRKIVIPVR